MLNYQPDDYDRLFTEKCDEVEARLGSLSPPAAQRIPSAASAYRMRAEFRLWHEDDDLYYAMFNPGDPRTPHRVDSFPIASTRIQAAMPQLREQILATPSLRHKVFQAEFLSTLSGELLITLIYHRALDEQWETAAKALAKHMDASVVGRSRKQKCVVGADYVEEQLPLAQGSYRYRQYEQAFTQPNAGVNCKMIDWACNQIKHSNGDLLELYCGNGNFTLPLSAHFRQVLATEVAKSSIHAAAINRDMNEVGNLAFVRLSAEEVSEALTGVRPFRRLKNLDIPLEDYHFSTVFVDPPRAGLDPLTLELVKRFERVVYVSCNPETLLGNLTELSDSYRISAFALFDQFPYTHHMESGVVLERR